MSTRTTYKDIPAPRDVKLAITIMSIDLISKRMEIKTPNAFYYNVAIPKNDTWPKDITTLEGKDITVMFIDRFMMYKNSKRKSTVMNYVPIDTTPTLKSSVSVPVKTVNIEREDFIDEETWEYYCHSFDIPKECTKYRIAFIPVHSVEIDGEEQIS